MQFNSNKQEQDNGAYQSHQGISPYPQPQSYQQNGMFVTPLYPSFWNDKVPTSISANLKMFLGISGFIYSLWGISVMSVQLAIVVNSFSTYYHGFWTGVFLIFEGILMMIAAFRLYYPLAHLIRLYFINTIFCSIGLGFSIFDYTMSSQCFSTLPYYCDNSLANNLRLMLVVLFGLAITHTLINMIFISKEHRRRLLQSNLNVSNY